MSYKPVVAAALSGGTLRQLSYWRSSRSTEAPLLAPALHEPNSRVSYSFPDVPYDMVASLLEDGVTAEEVAEFHPAVSATAARGALAFARYVDGYREPVVA